MSSLLESLLNASSIWETVVSALSAVCHTGENIIQAEAAMQRACIRDEGGGQRKHIAYHRGIHAETMVNADRDWPSNDEPPMKASLYLHHVELKGSSTPLRLNQSLQNVVSGVRGRCYRPP